MITDLGAEAQEYGLQARRAFQAAGGDALLQRAHADPAARDAITGPVLTDIGAWELAPREDPDHLEAAAALCRSAGYWALPYPVAERLSRTAHDDGLLAVADTRPTATIAGLPRNWGAVTLTGEHHTATATGHPGPAFTTALALTPTGHDATADLPLALVLPCWTLLGMLDRALELTIAHVKIRHQFGQPLAAFQSVQFQLTDAEVERAGLDMLAKHATWSLTAHPHDALHDALALRMAALEAAHTIFRITHQLHGAIGFCDETTLSWLSRHSQPLRRHPHGLTATRHHLTQLISTQGLTGLYHPEHQAVP